MNNMKYRFLPYKNYIRIPDLSTGDYIWYKGVKDGVKITDIKYKYSGYMSRSVFGGTLFIRLTDVNDNIITLVHNEADHTWCILEEDLVKQVFFIGNLKSRLDYTKKYFCNSSYIDRNYNFIFFLPFKSAGFSYLIAIDSFGKHCDLDGEYIYDENLKIINVVMKEGSKVIYDTSQGT